MYHPTIGLEIHIEINTRSKMFCSCLNDSGAEEPNINICPVCSGQPGVLPVVNKSAVEKTIKTGISLECDIPFFSKFDRKQYFYPDLPKGYQISQYDQPFCLNGFLEINNRKIRIERIHLEEDAGKLIHPKDKDYSLVDLNRAGTPLMELVTKPDIKSAKEAKNFVEELRLILRYLDVSNADMEKGELRVDANISLSLDDKLGTKVEIKNLNSLKAIEKAISYEIKRQEEILSNNEKVFQETRGWDEKKEKTFSQRGKEEAHDYRYFPEPDLPVFDIKNSVFDLDKIKSTILELPKEKKERFKKEYNLQEKEINFLVYEKKLGDYYEKVMSELNNWIKEVDIKDKVTEQENFKLSKLAVNYLLTDLQGYLKSSTIQDVLITPENFAEFITLIYKDKISSKIAKIVLKEMFETGGDPTNIIKDKNLTELSDESEIELIIEQVVSENGKAVNDYKSGKESSFQFLIGQVMSKTKGRVNLAIVGKILKDKLI
jgi:aspartyl-tRNA(Asn)/glutamyl-tRNA(Gln) amidotransferase subunit B